MSTYLMLTRISPETLHSPHSLETLEQDAMGRIREACPEVNWLQSYAIMGPYDYVDVFDAPNSLTAAKVATLMRTVAHAHSEVWPATEWGKFKEMLHSLPD